VCSSLITHRARGGRRVEEGKAVEGKGREEEVEDVIVLPGRGWRMDAPIP
jgi:hypothetical protein